MELIKKEVYFDKYCATCVNKDTDENKEPCETCLTTYVNDYSHKPVEYKEKTT